MITSFSGDPFLAQRAARQAVRDVAGPAGDVVTLAEGMDVDAVATAARQGGLFGSATLLLEFDAAFTGQAGTKERNAVMKELAEVPGDAQVIVIDASATPARQKRWRELGTHEHLPTPRFGALRGWIVKELAAQGVQHDRDVPDVLADLFGEDLPGLAAEIGKLAILEETLDAERVEHLVNRPAARGAFDMIDAIVTGDEATAMRTARLLVDAGEAPARILAALAWQFTLIARAVALRESQGDVPDAVAASQLGVARFPAGKAMNLARNLQERDVRDLLTYLLDVETAVKTGKRAEDWAIEATALHLAGRFAQRGGGRRRP